MLLNVTNPAYANKIAKVVRPAVSNSDRRKRLVIVIPAAVNSKPIKVARHALQLVPVQLLGLLERFVKYTDWLADIARESCAGAIPSSVPGQGSAQRWYHTERKQLAGRLTGSAGSDIEYLVKLAALDAEAMKARRDSQAPCWPVSVDIMEEQTRLIVDLARQLDAAKDMLAKTAVPRAPPSLVLCVVCMDRERTRLLLPCRHVVTCDICAALLPSCPVCRTGVRSSARVYFA